MLDFFDGKRVLVTGGTGFIGSNLVEILTTKGAQVRVVSKNKQSLDWKIEPEIYVGDLKNIDFCKKSLKDIDFVFHLAAEGFTSIANQSLAAKNFTPNIIINSNIMSSCKEAGVSHFLFCSSLNVYETGLDVLSDEKPWTGHPYDAQKHFAWTKRVGELQTQAFHELGDFKASIVRVGAAYGQHDNFDPKFARVIPSLIIKAFSDSDKIEVWGSGDAQRSFVFAKDIAEAMCLCMAKHSMADAINVGSQESTSINDLVHMIKELTNTKKKIIFDKTKPEGIPKITITTQKAKEKIGWEATTSLREGLKETISWYCDHILRKSN